MGIVINQSKGGELIETGEYPARVVSIEEADGQFGPQLKWKFELTGPDTSGKTLSAWCSQNFSIKSKLYAWTLAAFGGNPIPETYAFDSDDVIGRNVRLVVVVKAKADGSEFSKIDQVKASKTKPSHPVQSKPPDPVIVEDDPF